MKRPAGALPALLATLIPAAGCARLPHSSLLLITVDTLRADHLSIYAYARPTAPRIAALAANGVVFDTVLAPAPETGPACASLLTGRWPAELGVRGNGQPLRAGARTLAETLGAAGYETAGFVSGFPLVSRLSGLHRGFDHFDDDLPDPRGRVPGVQRAAAKTTDAVLAWLEKSAGSRPFFLWVHYYDVHGDYAPGPPYDTMFRDGAPGRSVPLELIPEYQRFGADTDAAAYVARYDGEIRRVDDQIGRLLAGLGERRDLSRTLVVLTADHGESLTENGYYFDHGNELYLPSLHIPLVLTGPGVPSGGRRVAGPAQTPDLMPTLLELLGQPPLPGTSGVSLVPALSSGRLPPRETFAEARFAPYRPLTPTADIGPKLAARDDRFTLILRLSTPRLEIYDRLADPSEVRNLAALPPADAAEAALRASLEHALRARLQAATQGVSPPANVLTPEARRQLERLSAGRPS